MKEKFIQFMQGRYGGADKLNSHLQKYVQLIAPITKKVDFFKRKRKDKTHKYYKCPTCKQVVRVPKGRGKIEINCPKCHTKFIKRT